jgi:uroporphyrinogen decarboxylase
MPNFENLQNTLLNKKSKYIPMIELGIDPKIKEKILGRPILHPKDDIDFMLQAGYDFVKIQPEIVMNLNRQVLQNSAQTADSPDRAWSPEGAGLITSWEEFDKYTWPKKEDINYSRFEKINKELPENMGIIGQYGDIFTNVWELMGFETFAMAIYEQPDLVEALFEKTSDLILNMFDTMADMESVGILWYSDDIAYSSNLMVSPDFLRIHFFPILTHIGKLARKRGIPFIYHTDGVLWEVMEDIIDCGVNALHPIEPKSMDIYEVKRKYGDRLCLCGGVEVDLLCRGTKSEVAELSNKYLEEIGSGGGYCLGSSNSIPNYINLQNYQTMLITGRNYQNKSGV